MLEVTPGFGPLKRLVAPVVVSTDFTDPYWNVSARVLLGWIGLVMAADLAAQWAGGVLGWWSWAMAVLTALMLASLPTRLSGALAGLSVTQALVSYGLLRLALACGLGERATEMLLWAWQGWCFVAFALLVLRYIRTPRAAMR